MSFTVEVVEQILTCLSMPVRIGPITVAPPISCISFTEIDGSLASGKLTGRADIHIPEEGAGSKNLAYDGRLKLDALQAETLAPALLPLPEDFLTVTGQLGGEIRFSGHGTDRSA